MSIKKIIVSLLLLITLSGCTSKGEIIMKNDGSIKEKVVIDVATNNLDKVEFDNYINLVLDNYNSALNLRGYSKNIVFNKDISKLEFTNNYDNICKYIENNLFTQYLYKKISCTEDELYYEIKNETNHISYCRDCTSWPSLDDVSFSITLPIKAVESSSDLVSNNTYTWNFDKNTLDSKEFYLKINKEELNQNNIKNEKINILLKIAVSSIILVGLVVICYMLVKKYKSKKLDY